MAHFFFIFPTLSFELNLFSTGVPFKKREIKTDPPESMTIGGKEGNF